MTKLVMDTTTAEIDGPYRYLLTRRWGRGPLMTFVMLNPSIADSTVMDPTFSKCIKLARREQFDGVRLVNLFAYRAPKPIALFEVADPVGPRNDDFVISAITIATATGAPIVAAWGAHHAITKLTPTPAWEIAGRIRKTLHCLHINKDGSPKHPLYIKDDAPLQVWQQGAS